MTTKAAPPKQGVNRGNAGKGRPKGSPNQTTTILKEAILIAAGEVGQDGKGRDGLVGYLRSVAMSNTGAFAALLGKVLPTQVVGDRDNPLSVVHRIELVAPAFVNGSGRASS